MSINIVKPQRHLLSGKGEARRRAVFQSLLGDTRTFATTLFTMVVDQYGTVKDEDGRMACLYWAPETLRMELRRDFGVEVPDLNIDKLMAAIAIVTTNFFLVNADRFIHLCNVLSGDDFEPDEFNPADAGEILWGVTEALLLNPPDVNEQFSPEICEYISQVLQEDGIMSPPDVLRLGLKPEQTARIASDFEDDPEMFQAVWEVQRGKTEDLVDLLRESLNSLKLQLDDLPLQHGDTAETLELITRMLSRLTGQT
jgi:hypothetical protein